MWSATNFTWAFRVKQQVELSLRILCWVRFRWKPATHYKTRAAFRSASYSGPCSCLALVTRFRDPRQTRSLSLCTTERSPEFSRGVSTCLFTLRKHAYSNILKILPPKNENFQIKNSDSFHISAKNIDCGYSLEPPRRGGSNEYPQSIFLAEIRKIMYTPVNSSFTT